LDWDYIRITLFEKPKKCKIKSKGIKYLHILEKSEVDLELAKKL
jgi:hypothetical protein